MRNAFEVPIARGPHDDASLLEGTELRHAMFGSPEKAARRANVERTWHRGVTKRRRDLDDAGFA